MAIILKATATKMCGCTAQEAKLTISLAGLRQRGLDKEHTKEAWCRMHGLIQGLEHGGIMNCKYGMGVGWGDIPLYVSDIKYFVKKEMNTYS